MSKRVNLANFTRDLMREYFLSIGEKPFHADQVIQWIHQYHVTSVSEMTNLSKRLRSFLQDNAEIRLPKISNEIVSEDGTKKWKFLLDDGNAIETVYIPEADRGTLCVSSQVGCAINCSFCATGAQGFKRNLTIAEIIGQLLIISRSCKITNVVLMGMGEPLLNFDNVVAATELMMSDFAYGLSKYRVTLSTCGIVPAMDKLYNVSEVSLAVSLHAPDDLLRDKLVPINKKHPLEELMLVCGRFFSNDSNQSSSRVRKVSFEYVMLKDVNDSVGHAKRLVKLLYGIACKVNLIPFNEVKNLPFECSSDKNIQNFRSILISAGINTIIRKKRGADIDAACGQLVGGIC